jgi:hypothetical protein
MFITEKDIFYYVFNPETVSEDKRLFISESEELLPLVNLYTDIKNALGEEISPDLKTKLAAKIPAYKLTKAYELFPWTIEASEYNPSTAVLAAATAETEQAVFSKTFIDKEKNIIIRLIGTVSRARLFVFPVSGEKLGEFTLTLNPGLQKYYFKDSQETKILENLPEINSISIEVYPQ